jgi:uncharacterized RDD family membrane protein YckC
MELAVLGHSMVASAKTHELHGDAEAPGSVANDAPAVDLPRAGFWIRLIAGFIDLAVLVVPFCVFVSFAAAAIGISNPFFGHRAGTALNDSLKELGPSFLALCICFFALQSWLYFACSESSRWRATLGKRLLGLYVGDLSGKPIDFWCASLRFCFGRLLAHVPLLGGYYLLCDCLYVGLNPRKRAIHDLLSGCVVLRESLHDRLPR